MYSLNEQINSANRASIEIFTTFANSAFTGVERFLALNMNAARNFLEEGSTTSRSWLAAKSLQDVVALQASVAKAEADKFGTYASRIFDIANKTREEMSQLAETRVSEINARLDQELDNMAKSAPAGADLAVVALRSTLAVASSAYRDMSKAAKQFNEMAEANFAVAKASKYARKAA
ncbi:MAG: phasin family protein [Sulfuritalea sp.]|nr:phasin family protein [Sulfuritalea sp.]